MLAVTMGTARACMSTVPSTLILGMKVSSTDYQHAASLIASWARQRLSKYVCVASVNNVMESYDSPAFRMLMNEADLVTPDGMPLVWGLKALGQKTATRVYGPDLTPVILETAERAGLKVGFYGGAPEVLPKLLSYVAARHPNLQVAYSFSPPFRPLTAEEDRTVVDEINKSGTSILFIGLNTPKQDYWMAAHKPQVSAVMVGVGAAFDFLSGSKPQAPRWMMRLGLEWLFRLVTEPRRLWKRYSKHNPRFVVLFGWQVLRHWLNGSAAYCRGGL